MGTKMVAKTCKWCDAGECWSHGACKGKGKGKNGGAKGKGKMKLVWVPVGRGTKGAGKYSFKAGRPGESNLVPKRAPAEKKIWISGCPEGTERGPALDKLNRELKKHLSQDNIECTAANVWRNGNGCAVFATKEDAEKALGTLSGTPFKDGVLEIDAWEKKQKDEEE